MKRSISVDASCELSFYQRFESRMIFPYKTDRSLKRMNKNDTSWPLYYDDIIKSQPSFNLVVH